MLRTIIQVCIVFIVCRYRDTHFNRVLAPEGEILSFASPKESIQSLGDPDATYSLRFSHLPGVVKRDSCPFDNTRHPCRVPNGLFPINAPMLGAAYGQINRYLRNMS